MERDFKRARILFGSVFRLNTFTHLALQPGFKLPHSKVMSSGSNIALTRLTEERKQWRKDHPFGFIAKPQSKPDGSLDMLNWECGVPGKAGGLWEGGTYKVVISFPPEYPAYAPKCSFVPPIPHPNVYPSGAICLSILKADWKPTIGIRQELLDEPNPKSPANEDAYMLFRARRADYEKTVKAFAAQFKPPEPDATVLTE